MLDRVHMTHAPAPQRAQDTGPADPEPAVPLRLPGPQPGPQPGRPAPGRRRSRPGARLGPAKRRVRPGRAAGAGLAAAAIWAAMTGPGYWSDPAGWIIGAAAVAVVAALAGIASGPVSGPVSGATSGATSGTDPNSGRAAPGPAPAAPRRRLSLTGALRLSGWFAVQALRGAVDVAGRALAPGLPVAPGWTRYPLRLPPGAPRLVMANAITLLPGTLTAELIEGGPESDHLIVHLLDARVDPAPDLAALEARVRGLFALPPDPAPHPAPAPPALRSDAPSPHTPSPPAPLALPRPKDMP